MIGSTTMAEESEADLILALANRFYAAIFNYLYQLLHDREGAQELTQEVFLRAYKQRAQLPSVANQRAWLYRVATNLALNAIKRRQRFAWLPWHQVDSLNLRQPDTSEQLGRQALVERALAALPAKYRAPLLLRNHYGFSVAEIARALDLSEDAVCVRLHRARQMFREAYERENEK